ncbi:hypothetical protein ACFQ09_07025 [Massilia norwichensis]|uniref:Dynamin family protein n=1 Tax=Massilia norwichensis TaxID=1442366 RepID=A0ABT2A915_9BURK|nr:hypothetical protein [Massilia norwichensis]MCS0590705.1 hypothetical protein [Massilia norwichensis]
MGKYTATARQNPGRKAWLVDFRHPLKTDNAGKPGRKTRKGLGTESVQEADFLVKQLQTLLDDESFWSVGAKARAAALFDARVIEIFYAELEPRAGNPRELRDQLLPLPGREDGYARIMLLGVPGAGKTTLLRQLMGTHPERDRFPSTSVNRTTTFPTEVFLRGTGYEAVVSFMSEHETRFEIEECVSAAVLEAISGARRQVARTLLEKSDMRFRLKYILGDIIEEDEEVDPYSVEDDDSSVVAGSSDPSVVTEAEALEFSQRLETYLDRIENLASQAKRAVEEAYGENVADMKPEDRNAALDLIQEQACESPDYLDIVSEILDDVRTRFDLIADGRFEKTTTGWPRAWHLKCEDDQRMDFLAAVRFFSGISVNAWGKLLTPVVNGMRVGGPFHSVWAEQEAKLVLIDTEGLGHKAGANADLPEQMVLMLDDADVILLVDSAKNAMTNFAAGKAVEGIVNSGHSSKLVVAFTHMDTVSGENLKGRAKLDHVFGGLRNVVENQVAKSVSADAARYLLEHLEKSTFYLGRLDDYEAKPARPELNRLLQRLVDSQPAVFEPVAFPEYSVDNLVLAIQRGARMFRSPWRAILGFESHPDETARHWQTIKALSRRYAEGWPETFTLRPTTNLITALSSAISRFLENPASWSGTLTSEEKRETIERIKTLVTRQLPALCARRLREQPQSTWVDAFGLRGPGSTFERRMKIEGIYERWVPIPDERGDREVQEFMNDVKVVVMSAISVVKDEVEANAAQ